MKSLLRIWWTAVALAGVVSAAGVHGLSSIKLAACTINKSGSTVIFRLLNAAAGEANFSTFAIGPHRDTAFTRYAHSKLKAILSDPEWTKFAVLREPAERFASAFQHKCVRTPTKGICPESDPNKMSDVHAVLTAVERMVAVATDSEQIDAHFRPYAESCDLSTSLSSYIVIHYDELQAGLVRVVKLLPTVTAKKRSALLSAVKVLFPQNVSAVKVDALNRAPPDSSLALAQGWRNAAAAIPRGAHPDADIIPRLKKIYAADFKMFQSFTKQRGPVKNL
jgi:hypothetical protein